MDETVVCELCGGWRNPGFATDTDKLCDLDSPEHQNARLKDALQLLVWSNRDYGYESQPSVRFWTHLHEMGIDTEWRKPKLGAFEALKDKVRENSYETLLLHDKHHRAKTNKADGG